MNEKMTAHPPLWLTSLKEALEEARLIPTWNTELSFSWESFSKDLREALDIPSLSVSLMQSEWLSEDALLSGMGEKPFVQALSLSPLREECFVVMPQSDLIELSQWVLTEKKQKETLLDENVKKGFFLFTLLSALRCFSTEVEHRLTPRTSPSPLKKQRSFVLDVALKKGQTSVWTRIIFSKSLRDEANAFFARETSSLTALPHDTSIPLPLSITAGHVRLTATELKALKRGDFVILDHASITPKTGKGTCQLCLHSSPLFQIKIKETEIKILEYPIQTEETPMEDDEIVMDEEHPAEEKLNIPTEIPLTVTVELGKLSLPLSELLALRPGNVIATGFHTEKPVRLIVEGKAVAEGLLTQVGDIIGVQITRAAQKK